jgi:hypothetical protein
MTARQFVSLTALFSFAGISSLAPLSGCGTPSVTSILAGQINDQLPDFQLVTVINQSQNDVELDIMVDGTAQTLTCSAALQRCDFPISGCPTQVEAVQQRYLDSQGRFVGGRNFNSSADFTFTPGEFDCDSVLIFKFTDTTAEAFAI